jgi:hypothetical protein
MNRTWLRWGAVGVVVGVATTLAVLQGTVWGPQNREAITDAVTVAEEKQATYEETARQVFLTVEHNAVLSEQDKALDEKLSSKEGFLE